MRAVIWTAYGPPEVLQVQRVERPSPGKNQVLIKIHATTVETGDCELRRYQIHNGLYSLFRPYFGLFKPRLLKVLGQQLSGEIESVGSAVTRFKPGDRVLAAVMTMGTTCEYLCLDEKDCIVPKPDALSYEEAAALSVGGLNALHFLNQGDIHPGDRVLIYGSSGTIGTFAVQLAKHFGAEVTAVCSAAKSELVRGLGADHLIDYQKEHIGDAPQPFDVIFDTIGKSPYQESLDVLNPGGIYLLANPTFHQQMRSYWTNITTNKRTTCQLARYDLDSLHYLTHLVVQGALKVVIDRCFRMDEIVAAHHYVEQGHKSGNVVVTIVEGETD
ncbi:MAG: NAD(P)-dependent alcohol dehydrogenase [Chromatiales bacterium]|nr:NAD(P)-dependent alcohol dehydrogenase [Chromatiales bacterium]